MIGVDTSVIVRYLVGVPTEQAQRATRLIESDEQIGISLVVLLEAAHVLRTQYGVPRPNVLIGLIDLIARENIAPLELPKTDMLDALVRARAHPSTPLADSLISTSARTFGAVPVFTFDRQFGRLGAPVATP